ncbi:hypothetical protein V1525DRAFT_405729 [Lipomyces kononenkoae]|uniref:Uncharacterized protein n=1 Tax=Lipomyces kononenkoae TaxID=34357 RepID=A0ACC3SYU4_LIPKO
MPPKKGSANKSTTSRSIGAPSRKASSQTKQAKSNAQKQTNTRSEYFNRNGSGINSSNEYESDLSELIEDVESDPDEDGSEFGSSVDNESEDDKGSVEYESRDEEDVNSVKKRKLGTRNPARKSQTTPKKSTKRPKRVEDDDNNDGEFDSREVFIPKRPPRPLNGIDYEQHNIHPNTFLFLKDLKKNNEREWFWDHESEYRAAKKDFDEFVETLSARMTQIDETIPPLPLKDISFRIYRDIRFSNDKTPYKPYFAAAYSRTGRVGRYAHYYLHLEPGQCRIGGGMWHLSESNNQGLQIMRRLIDRGGKRFKAIIDHPDMSKHFFRNPKLSPLEQFVAMNQGDALKTNPKGYRKDHKDIQLLRLRSYTIHRVLSDDVFAPKAAPIEKIIPIFRALVPFIQFLNSVIMDREESENDADSQGSGVEESDVEDH